MIYVGFCKSQPSIDSPVLVHKLYIQNSWIINYNKDNSSRKLLCLFNYVRQFDWYMVNFHTNRLVIIVYTC